MVNGKYGYSESPSSERGSRSRSVGIGELLKKAREEKGLRYEELSKKTRLRASAIKAIENEDWEQLPSPVIVRGFIRSYAKAVGLDEEEVIRLCKGLELPEAPLPGPPHGVAARKRGALFGTLIFLLIISVGLAVYFWKDDSLRSLVSNISTEGLEKEMEKPPSDESTLEPDAAVQPEKTGQEEVNETAVAAPEEKPVEIEEPVAAPVDFSIMESEPRSGGEETMPSPPKEGSSAELESTPAASKEVQRLKAVVEERTWLRIVVDDKEPKEYIFYPGSRPEWKAEKGFDLVIGNAGGIRLEINEKELPPLGETGEVVRLKLPKEEE